LHAGWTLRERRIVVEERARNRVDASAQVVAEDGQRRKQVGRRQTARGDGQRTVQEILLQVHLLQTDLAGSRKDALDEEQIVDRLRGEALPRWPARADHERQAGHAEQPLQTQGERYVERARVCESLRAATARVAHELCRVVHDGLDADGAEELSKACPVASQGTSDQLERLTHAIPVESMGSTGCETSVRH